MKRSSPAVTPAGYLAALVAAPGTTELPNHEPSFWLRARIADIKARWAAGDMLGCRHVLHSECTCLVGFWLPHVMCCAACAPHVLTLPEPDDHVCDRCGTHDPATRALAHREASVILLMGLCRGCYSREVPA